MRSLVLDAPAAIDTLTSFLSNVFDQAGFSRAVLGLSGGIDSALSTALAARALGPTNVWAVMMPYRSSDPRSLEDAKSVAQATGVHAILEEITPQIDEYFANHEGADPMRRGNKMARERMTILYDHSHRLDALVVGTGNRTEYLLGYTTIYGDNVSAVNPIAGLYKAQVRQLARELGIPETVVTKPPSADLWAGQTDEDELGFTYESVDPLLVAMFDEKLSREELLEDGFEPSLIDRVTEIHRRTAFKRRPPIAAPAP
jgi:NAD+ synthase